MAKTKEKNFVVVTGRIPIPIHTEADRKMAGRDDSFQSLVVNAIEAFARTGVDATKQIPRDRAVTHKTPAEIAEVSIEDRDLASAFLRWWHTPASEHSGDQAFKAGVAKLLDVSLPPSKGSTKK